MTDKLSDTWPMTPFATYKCHCERCGARFVLLTQYPPEYKHWCADALYPLFPEDTVLFGDIVYDAEPFVAQGKVARYE
jgi:hypothetical protein